MSQTSRTFTGSNGDSVTLSVFGAESLAIRLTRYGPAGVETIVDITTLGLGNVVSQISEFIQNAGNHSRPAQHSSRRVLELQISEEEANVT